MMRDKSTTKHLLNNRIKYFREIGRGGMGVVYEGYDLHYSRRIAVKKIFMDTLHQDERQCMVDQARGIANIDHPNIVTMYDVIEEENVLYTTMEYLDGHTLREDPPKNKKEIIAAAIQICEALSEAHAHGIIHRDLKPENVFLLADGIVKLTDFGLAITSLPCPQEKGGLEGTVLYMSPEQALGKPLDGRTDLYSLGIMLFELFAHKLPFEANDPLAVVSWHIHGSPEPLLGEFPDIPLQIKEVIINLLEKEPEDRYKNAQGLQAVLRKFYPAAGLNSSMH